MAFASSILVVVSKLSSIFIGILGIGFLIGFHEFGHFIFCKIFNIATPTFSIGMGPRIITKKLGGTDFTLSAIPLGGYVEIKGASQEDTGKNSDPRSFAQKPYWQKMLVIAGGIVFNLLFAYWALALLFFIGMPKASFVYPQYASSTISAIEKDSPAEKAKLQKDDTIVAVDGKAVQETDISPLVDHIRNNPGKNSSFTIKRNSKEEKLKISIGKRTVQDKTAGYIGVDFAIPRYSLLESIKFGISTTHAIVGQVFGAFKSIFVKRSTENIGGPLMVIMQTVQGASKGLRIFLLLLAFISINLAVLNVIPVPIMDGGQALFYTIEAVIRRPLPEYVKIYIHYACWAGVLALAIFLSIKDVLRIFWGS